MPRDPKTSGAAPVADDRLLRKREAAVALACSPRTIDRLVSLGRLTRVKVLGGVRFRLSQVQALMSGGAA
jgi:excisionase family DNA binding protein